jgi:hypothetical protein
MKFYCHYCNTVVRKRDKIKFREYGFIRFVYPDYRRNNIGIYGSYNGDNIIMTNLVNAEAISKCIEYAEDSEKFKKLVNQLVVTTKLIGYDKYFEEDKDARNIYRVTIKRNNKQISFRFGDSINNTNMGYEPDLYSILSCVSSEFDVPESFADFCDEFGYDIDSIKHLRNHKAALKQSEKLHKLFDEEEIQAMPR